jgi:hypothetical protein
MNVIQTVSNNALLNMQSELLLAVDSNINVRFSKDSQGRETLTASNVTMEDCEKIEIIVNKIGSSIGTLSLTHLAVYLTPPGRQQNINATPINGFFTNMLEQIAKSESKELKTDNATHFPFATGSFKMSEETMSQSIDYHLGSSWNQPTTDSTWGKTLTIGFTHTPSK